MSSSFRALAAPVLPLGEEYGVELFYNAAVTPWCRVTADLQVARPSGRDFDTAIIPGIRMEAVF